VLHEWMWALLYLSVLSFEMVYVKHVLNRLPMTTCARVHCAARLHAARAILHMAHAVTSYSTHPLRRPRRWTRVYYNNALALLFWPPFLLLGNEHRHLQEAFAALSESRAAATVSISCVLGVGISFTGFGASAGLVWLPRVVASACALPTPVSITTHARSLARPQACEIW